MMHLRSLETTQEDRIALDLGVAESNFLDWPTLTHSFTLFITVKTITKLNLEHSGRFEIEINKINRR